MNKTIEEIRNFYPANDPDITEVALTLRSRWKKSLTSFY